jgi:hypothetical protein
LIDRCAKVFELCLDFRPARCGDQEVRQDLASIAGEIRSRQTFRAFDQRARVRQAAADVAIFGSEHRARVVEIGGGFGVFARQRASAG